MAAQQSRRAREPLGGFSDACTFSLGTCTQIPAARALSSYQGALNTQEQDWEAGRGRAGVFAGLTCRSTDGEEMPRSRPPSLSKRQSSPPLSGERFPCFIGRCAQR
eukprot:756372-Hanusia_phi.AAC.5